jgi:hypothetical protein
MMESDADRLDAIQALGGIPIQSTTGDFWAIFDRQYDGVGMGDLDIESRTPAMTCRSCDVKSRTKDEVLSVPDGDFRILRIQPDTPAPGWSVVILRS